MTTTTVAPETATTDWVAWARRLEATQVASQLRRAERYRIMLELTAEVLGPQPRAILDLASGSGTFTALLRERFPSVSVVALDGDPMLVALGEQAHGTDGGKIRWERGDMLAPDWDELVKQDAPFDGVLTTMSLHSLSVGNLMPVYQKLGRLVRPGGLFLNAEYYPVAPPTNPLTKVANAVRKRLEGPGPGGETYEEWWAAARAEPAFKELMDERERVFRDHESFPVRAHTRLHEEGLAWAGFSHTALLWRFLDDSIYAAIR